MKYINLIKNVTNWPTYLSFKLGINKTNPLQFSLRPGNIKINMTPAMKPLFSEIFMTEVYEDALSSIHHDTPIILDVGGNMGYFALYSFLRKPNASIYSFEPVPKNFTYLQTNKTAHPQFDWELFNSAVSNQSGDHDFFYDDEYSPEGIDVSASLFSAERIHTVGGKHKKIKVPVLNLSEWMEENKLQVCDLLKLDCEGAEYNILYSMLNSCFRTIRYIVADVHLMTGKGENIDDLAAFLRTKGYEVKTVNQELLYAKQIIPSN
jgi:FkbM family methyltransferase